MGKKSDGHEKEIQEAKAELDRFEREARKVYVEWKSLSAKANAAYWRYHDLINEQDDG